MPCVRRCSFFLSLLLSLSCGWAQSPEQIDGISSALQEKEFSKALQLLQPILQAFPADARLWAMQGSALAGQGNSKDALASFDTALKLAPDYVPALQGAAQIEFEAANPAGIPPLRRLLRMRPNDPIAHGMLAVLEYQQGSCSAAVVHFEKAGALFDTKLQALHAYATCLVRLKQFDKAIIVLQRAVALNGSDPQERRLLASVQVMDHQPNEALATLTPLLDGTPDADILELTSAAYEDAQKTDKAVDALRQAIVANPQNVQLYVDFAALASAHQSFDVGINVVNDGISLQPKAAPLYFARGVLNVQLGQYDKAQADFETAYALDPSQSLSVAAQGLSAIQQNDMDRALASVQEKLLHRPNDPILLYVQADILVEQGAEPGSADFQTALRSAKRAVTLDSTLGPARAVLAKLYLQAGQYSEAAAQCRKALEIDPKDQASVYHLIQALRKNDRHKEIPELLRRLALLRQDATKQERAHYRYKLIEGDSQPK